MEIGKVYLIKAMSIDQGSNYNAGEKPQTGIYIAYTPDQVNVVKSNLVKNGFKRFDVDEVRLDSLIYLPFLLRQRIG
jgi:hypothetical protein